jgi:hypothetical protein
MFVAKYFPSYNNSERKKTSQNVYAYCNMIGRSLLAFLTDFHFMNSDSAKEARWTVTPHQNEMWLESVEWFLSDNIIT